MSPYMGIYIFFFAYRKSYGDNIKTATGIYANNIPPRTIRAFFRVV